MGPTRQIVHTKVQVHLALQVATSSLKASEGAAPVNLGVLHSECEAPPSKERHLKSQSMPIDDSWVCTLAAMPAWLTRRAMLRALQQLRCSISLGPFAIGITTCSLQSRWTQRQATTHHPMMSSQLGTALLGA